jgi:hypothetical protein
VIETTLLGSEHYARQHLDTLSDKDQSLARIMLEHEQYHNQFEMADLLHDHHYDIDSEVNPFIHIIFHQIIENQLASREPIEVFQFYNAMRNNKVSRHETIHSIATIFSFLLHKVLKDPSEFDLEKYKSLLRRFKNKKPEKIMPALEREFQ